VPLYNPPLFPNHYELEIILPRYKADLLTQIRQLLALGMDEEALVARGSGFEFIAKKNR
jgi:hypothetical protein